LFGNVFLLTDGAKMYTPVYMQKLSGLHKGNTVTKGIYQKATRNNKIL